MKGFGRINRISKMRILHINTNDQDGGAARAAYRIYQGEKRAGIDARFLSIAKHQDDSQILTIEGKKNNLKKQFNMRWTSLLMKLAGVKVKTPWNPNIIPFYLMKPFFSQKWNIVHLHWINDGMMDIRELADIKSPVVWTLHDSWAFTGGCHIPYKCREYEQGCKKCPQLIGGSRFDLAQIVFNAKVESYPKNMTIVCPSSWLAECARNSLLFHDKDIRVIPNGVDMKRYCPQDKAFSRRVLGISSDCKLILFGAMGATSDENKGFKYLYKAIRKLPEKLGATEKVQLVVFGSGKPENDVDFGFPVRYMGRLYDDVSLTILYSAADVMVVPSKSENLPNAVVETMACGTPCVGFRIGGIPDLIDHKETGYLAEPYEADDLANGIAFVLEDYGRKKAMSKFARERIEKKCNLDDVVEQYRALYETLIG